jgi:hypothetical protein
MKAVGVDSTNVILSLGIFLITLLFIPIVMIALLIVKRIAVKFRM